MKHILFFHVFLLQKACGLRFPCCFLFAHGFVHLAGLTQGRYNDVNCAWKGCWMPWCWEICRSSWNCWGGEQIRSKILTAVKHEKLKILVVTRGWIYVYIYVYSDGLFDMVCQPRTLVKRSIYLWFAFFKFGTAFLITWSFKNRKKKTQKSHDFNPNQPFWVFTFHFRFWGPRFQQRLTLAFQACEECSYWTPSVLVETTSGQAELSGFSLMEGIIYSLKINMEHNSLEVDGRSCSFPNGWFVGSMLIFQGVFQSSGWWFWVSFFFSPLSGEDCHLD